MSSLDYYRLLAPDGVYADPTEVTDVGRLFHNFNARKETASAVVKTSNGLLFGFTVSSEIAQYIQVFDATSLPSEGAVPLLSFQVALGGYLSLQWVPPRYMEYGIVLCNSSTQHTKTIGTTDCIFDVNFL